MTGGDRITGKTVVAGVVGRPVAHSLSPALHNAWLKAAGIDGVYVPFAPDAHGFERLVHGFRGGAIRGVNVTLPFKEEALRLADRVSDAARDAAAANVLLFEPDGRIVADNTDGFGLLKAFEVQAPQWSADRGPVTVVGAGGAARGAVAALIRAGAPKVFVVNRTLARAEAIAHALGAKVRPLPLPHAAGALRDSTAVVNATSAGLAAEGALDLPLDATPDGCVVMDMVYKPLETPVLAQARALGRPVVDGLEMLIRQAEPSFEAFFGRYPPADVDVRALALEALGL
ncbi:shikimate dehydrogenase [Phenylobacterium sp. SCN 70-31]|uniref:shikimate dehydrogenase n=1 Tax=Phenylobacterium sp. SCN 70-31 TaxID=1660129 RepID=UPI00086D3539|nr:shikimate dehydrogenase [Phenylobacterium sp. SCN 70-31]ODT88225.1 MAG: shikimate dehydrogenase [Phenylobacterium sp. SCN 70-31]